MQVQPYLTFDGRCEEAIEFYKGAVGAQVQMMMRMSEAPEPPPPGAMPAGTERKIMHAAIQIGESVVMASDGYCSGQAKFEGFSLSAMVADSAEAERVYAALSSGGETTMPLTKTFFSPAFGMLKDKFGVAWMVMAQP